MKNYNNFLTVRDINNKPYKVKTSAVKFRPSIYGVLIRDNKVLLVPQWDGYDFPGGGIKVGENLDRAFKREFWEETGLLAKRGEVIEITDSFFLSIESKKPYHAILIYCLVKSFKGKLTDKYFDKYEKTYAKKAKWVDLKQAFKLKFYNGVNSPQLIKKASKLYGK